MEEADYAPSAPIRQTTKSYRSVSPNSDISKAKENVSAGGTQLVSSQTHLERAAINYSEHLPDVNKLRLKVCCYSP